MSPFEWLKDLEKSGFLQNYEKRRFQAKLETIPDEDARTFMVSLQWKDRMNQTGEIFIPAEGIKRMHSKIIDLENQGFKEEKGQQIYPP